MTRNVVTIGAFDGVHAGHAALITRAREIAAGGRVVVMSFDPHPASVLRADAAPQRLTTFQRRTTLLRAAGADEVVKLTPTQEILSQGPREFIGRVIADHAPAAFVEGSDFRFGRARTGDVALLEEIGRDRGFTVDVIPTVEVALTDNTIVRASSTVTRWLLENGRLADAQRLLGRPYDIDGVVEQGDRRGRTIGCPTINIDTPCMLPADGVYAGVAELPDGRRFGAAVSVGDKPTFDGRRRVVEAHLLDAPRDGDRIDGLDEYGWSVRLEVHAWIRDQVRYGAVEPLIEQIKRDCDRIRVAVRDNETLTGATA